MEERYNAGTDCRIDSGATVGYVYTENPSPAKLGEQVVVRSGTKIYCDVSIGDNVQTGHDALVREHTQVGDGTLIGSQTVIDGRSSIGGNVSLQTGVYVPQETTIEDNVFVGPHATLTNDMYPQRIEAELEGPTLKRSASVGANSTILPDVTVGERSFVAAGAIVTEDVPSGTLAVGSPAEFNPLPEELQGENDI